ncbi:hypothetical protein F511_33573 [Dorcoceras hygrometricum]|uniref:Uncharacterized protein n=1 Tax=Dorcoceras hygrometricum TaxID=472368 RepID=A0A2Z7AFI0_9LAMI|nr:hypothetical protein F511_33573 [Dorcoceras hygrometricum]
MAPTDHATRPITLAYQFPHNYQLWYQLRAFSSAHRVILTNTFSPSCTSPSSYNKDDTFNSSGTIRDLEIYTVPQNGFSIPRSDLIVTNGSGCSIQLRLLEQPTLVNPALKGQPSLQRSVTPEDASRFRYYLTDISSERCTRLDHTTVAAAQLTCPAQVTQHSVYRPANI